MKAMKIGVWFALAAAIGLWTQTRSTSASPGAGGAKIGAAKASPAVGAHR